MADWLIAGAVGWLAVAVAQVISQLWGLLAQTAFTTPDVTGLPQVVAVTGTSMAVVNVCFILAIITVGILVMARGVVATRQEAGELLPRLVVGWIAANFAIPLCRNLIGLANALSSALTGGDITAQDSLTQLRSVILDALANPVSALLAAIIGLVLAALTAMLIVTWLTRLGLLIILVGVSPLALACHATPYTDAAARLWWRALLGTLATVLLQALALHTALSIFLDPEANMAPLGIPHDPTGTFNLFIALCLMWAVVKIPGLMRRYVTRGRGGPNVAGVIVRTVLIQQLTGALRAPWARRAGAASGGPARPDTSGRWSTRLPQPVGPSTPRPGSIRPAAARPAPAAPPRPARLRAPGTPPPSGPRPTPPATPGPTPQPAKRPPGLPTRGPWSTPPRRR